MPEQETIIDFDDRTAKVGFLGKLGGLSGRWRVIIRPYRPRRSLKANAYYWAAVIPAWQTFMKGHGQYFEPAEIHEFFLRRFMGKTMVCPTTGELLTVIGNRSSKTDSAEFSEYVNDVIGWMNDRYGVMVLPPEERVKEKV